MGTGNDTRKEPVDRQRASAALHRIAAVMMRRTPVSPDPIGDWMTERGLETLNEEAPRRFPRATRAPSEGGEDAGAEIRALAAEQKQRLASDDAVGALRAPTGLGHVAVAEPSEPARETSRVTWALVGVIGVLLVATTALATALAVGGRESRPAVAAAPAAEAPVPAAKPPAPIPAPPPRAEPEPAPTEQARAPEIAATVPSAAPAREPAVERVRKRSRRKRRRRERPRHRVARVERAAAPTPAAPAPPARRVSRAPSKATGGDAAAECDRVTCLIDPSAACCGRTEPATPATAAAPDPNLPAMLTAASVTDGLRGFRGRLETCGDTNGFSGTARVQLEIDGAGRVASVVVLDGDVGFRNCVRRHIRRARFAKSREGVTINYPLIIR